MVELRSGSGTDTGSFSGEKGNGCGPSLRFTGKKVLPEPEKVPPDRFPGPKGRLQEHRGTNAVVTWGRAGRGRPGRPSNVCLVEHPADANRPGRGRPTRVLPTTRVDPRLRGPGPEGAGGWRDRRSGNGTSGVRGNNTTTSRFVIHKYGKVKT